MRIVILIFSILFFSCSSTNTRSVNKIDPNGIVYILPGNVQEILLKKNLNNSYFVLTKIEDLNFRIYVESYDKKSNWIKNTNRYIVLSDNFFPLLFEFDNYFANAETAKEYIENYNNGIYQRTIITNSRENVYHIDFNIRGDILYQGF